MPLPPRLHALHQDMMLQASMQEERRALDLNGVYLFALGNCSVCSHILLCSGAGAHQNAQLSTSTHGPCMMDTLMSPISIHVACPNALSNGFNHRNASDSRNTLPTPEPSLTPVTHSVASHMHCPSEKGTLPSYTPTNRRRCRTEDTLLDHDGPLYPARKRHKSSSYADIGCPPQPDHERETPELDLGPLPQPEPEGGPRKPGFNPPHNTRPPRKCLQGACRSRINVDAARRPEEHEDEAEDEDEENQEQLMEGEEGKYGGEDEVRDDRDVQPVGSAQLIRGSWRRRASDEPKISCSDKASAIIAELASAHCQSSIHDPLIWLRDIAGYVQTPYVEDESLLSVVARCRGIASKDICTNFLVMVNYMTLVCKCQGCVFPFLCLTTVELVCPIAYVSRRVST